MRTFGGTKLLKQDMTKLTEKNTKYLEGKGLVYL